VVGRKILPQLHEACQEKIVKFTEKIFFFKKFSKSIFGKDSYVKKIKYSIS